MSDSDHRDSASATPPARRHPALTVLMIAGGIILLLPGLCSLVFIVVLVSDSFRDAFSDSGLVMLWLVCFAVAAGGILLIRHAVRRGKVPARSVGA